MKKILFAFVLLVLLLPLSQDIYPFIKSEPLFGVYTTSENVQLSRLDKWLDGSYQEQKSNYLNDHVAFRPDMIRLNCQVDYSLFSLLNTGWGVIGKHQTLLDGAYINALDGADYLGYDTLYTKIYKLKKIQDTLAKLGKSLIIVHPASKAYYYADCVPDSYPKKGEYPANLATMMRIGDSLGVNQIDLNTWFCHLRATSKDLLYAKQGIHWSFYGGMVAADTIIRYIENLRKISMPHPYLTDLVHTTKAQYTDNDIARCMNLIWPITTETFTYGKMICEKDSSKTKPRAIYIGDSFVWTIINNYVPDCINSYWEFWFYFKERYSLGHQHEEDKLPMDNYNWQATVDKTDYIVILYNASTLRMLGNGFIEAEYAHYYPMSK